MSIRHSRLALVALFVISLLLHMACFGYVFLIGAVYVEDLQTLTVRTLAVYSVPLGVIIGGIFGGTADPAGPAAPGTFWTAAAFSLLWNVLLVWRTVLFAFGEQDSITSLLSYVDAVAAGGTFLIGGALAYYFAK